MPNTFAGYVRLTHKYVDGYKHLDEEEYKGIFHILSVSAPQDYDESSDSWARTYRVKAPAGLTREEIEGVLRNEFRYGCRCEHDCCGHTQSYVRARGIKHIKRREYWVSVNFYLNC